MKDYIAQLRKQVASGAVDPWLMGRALVELADRLEAPQEDDIAAAAEPRS